MKPVAPRVLHDGAVPIVYAEDQPEYTPLPAGRDADGLVLTEWELTDEERKAIANGARVRLWIYTFNHALQPVALAVTSEEQVRHTADWSRFLRERHLLILEWVAEGKTFAQIADILSMDPVQVQLISMSEIPQGVDRYQL